MTEHSPLRYTAALDGVRALAVLSVIAFHSGLRFAVGGALGVDVFFVLSGFLITTLMIDEWHASGSTDTKAFYVRRAFRILPALAVCIVGCWIAARLRGGSALMHATSTGAVAALLFVGNWVRVSRGNQSLGLLNHTWSLGIEEQFYILWPLLTHVILTKGRARALDVLERILVVLVVLVLCWRLVLMISGASPERIYNGTDTRSDALFIGALFAVWRVKGRISVARGWIIVSATAAVLGALAFAQPESALLYGIGLTGFALLAGVLILSVTTSDSWLFRTPPVVWVGRLSYSLYLWHYPVLQMFPRLHMRALYVHSIRLATIIVLAAASHYLVERPFLRLRVKRGWGAASLGHRAPEHNC
jgi:peptidoglycan/LPS O-acetylase OafA/YrhL